MPGGSGSTWLSVRSSELSKLWGDPHARKFCEAGDLDKGQVSRLVKRLIQQGLFIRSVSSQGWRTVNIALSERGRALARLPRATTLRLNCDSITAVPATERVVLSAAMSALAEKVRLMHQEECRAPDRRRKLSIVRRARVPHRSNQRRPNARSLKR